MTRYSQHISERLKHTKIKQGHCLICGNFGPLSVDHVPPKGANSLKEIEQFHITEVLSEPNHNIKGIRSPNGGKFKTVCHRCNNNILGERDPLIKEVCHSISSQAKGIGLSQNTAYQWTSTKIDVYNFARAMAGHILAATSCDECRPPPKETSYFSPLQNFVLGKNLKIEDTHDFYSWFYPYRKQISAKFVGYHIDGKSYCLSALHFHPISFIITQKGIPVLAEHAQKLDLNADRLNIPIAIGENLDFPFSVLEGNRFYMIASQQCTISFPQKNR